MTALAESRVNHVTERHRIETVSRIARTLNFLVLTDNVRSDLKKYLEWEMIIDDSGRPTMPIDFRVIDRVLDNDSYAKPLKNSWFLLKENVLEVLEDLSLGINQRTIATSREIGLDRVILISKALAVASIRAPKHPANERKSNDFRDFCFSVKNLKLLDLPRAQIAKRLGVPLSKVERAIEVLILIDEIEPIRGRRIESRQLRGKDKKNLEKFFIQISFNVANKSSYYTQTKYNYRKKNSSWRVIS